MVVHTASDNLIFGLVVLTMSDAHDGASDFGSHITGGGAVRSAEDAENDADAELMRCVVGSHVFDAPNDSDTDCLCDGVDERPSAAENDTEVMVPARRSGRDVREICRVSTTLWGLRQGFATKRCVRRVQPHVS